MRRELRLDSRGDSDRNPAARLSLVAQPVSMVAALQAASRAALDQVTHNRPLIATDKPEALHQVRVGLRHLDAAIRFFSAHIPRSRRALLARELKWFGRKLSRAREIDVFLAEVIARIPPEKNLGSDIAAVELLCRREREREYARVRKVLASRRFHAFILTVEKELVEEESLLSSSASNSCQAAAAAGLMRMKRKLGEGRDIDALGRDRLHKFRLRSKRMRYAIEFVAPLFDRRTAKLARRMSDLLRRLQNELGTVTDRTAHAQLVETLQKSKSSGADKIAWKKIKRLLFARCREEKAASLKRAQKAYRKFAKIELH